MQRGSTLLAVLNLCSAGAVIVCAVYLLRQYNSGGVSAAVAISRPFFLAAGLGLANLLHCLWTGEIRLGGARVSRALQPKLYWGALLAFSAACTGLAAVAISQG